MRLTAEGESLIDFARRIVQIEAGAVAALSRKDCAAPYGLASRRLRRELPCRDPWPLQPQAPMVEVSVSCEGSPELAQQVAAGALDSRS